MDVEHAPFSKGLLATFRHRLIERELDRRLIERTVDLAAETRAVGSRQLLAALDSSPLWGDRRWETRITFWNTGLDSVRRTP